jgi:hypothetical protein
MGSRCSIASTSPDIIAGASLAGRILNRPLVDRQKQLNLIIDGAWIEPNAAQAAIRAGYSAKTARFIGAENLTKPNIAASLEKARDKRAERTELTADWVIDELAQDRRRQRFAPGLFEWIKPGSAT